MSRLFTITLRMTLVSNGSCIRSIVQDVGCRLLAAGLSCRKAIVALHQERMWLSRIDSSLQVNDLA